MFRKKLPFASLLLVAITMVAIAGNVLFDLDLLQPLECRVYDWMTRLRQRKAANQVVVLAIDDQSIKQLGSWPWPRSYIADMVRQLSGSGTHTLGLSLLYPARELNPGLREIERINETLNDRPSKSDRKLVSKISGMLEEAEERLNHDNQLISAIRAARNVVLPLRFTLGSLEDDKSERLSDWLKLNSIEPKNIADTQNHLPVAASGFRGILNHHRLIAGRITEPYHELSTKAGALGHTNLTCDKDGVVRKMPLLISYRDRDFVSFAFQVARKFAGGRLSDTEVEPTQLILRHLQIPTE
jgi:serine/threonine-protein kinase